MEENKKLQNEETAEIAEVTEAVETAVTAEPAVTQEVDVYETAGDILLEVGHEAEPDVRKPGEKGILRIGMPLFVICAAVALIVSFVHTITADVIAEAAAQQKREAIVRIFGEAEITEGEPLSGTDAFFSVEDRGWCVNLTAGGFGGDIALMVGVNADGTVRGVEILSHSETPGFGAKADDPDYLGQYSGKSGKFALGRDVDAISGATISSRAILGGVNQALDALAGAGLIEGAIAIPGTWEEDERVLQHMFDSYAEVAVCRAPAGVEALYAVKDWGWGIRLNTDGFGGKMTLMVGIDTDGVVFGVEILEHSESRWPEDSMYLIRFVGMSADMLTEDPVDAVSGATLSSRAIYEGVMRALEIAASEGLIPSAGMGGE